MWVARLTPALRLDAEGVAHGDIKTHYYCVLCRRRARPLFQPAYGFQLARVVPLFVATPRLGGDRRADRRSFEPSRFVPGIAARADDGKTRPQMAPQRIEKIESA